LAGTTRDEWRIFDAALDEGVFTEQYVRDRAHALAGDGHDADAVVATYRADHRKLRDVASAMVTDYHFTAPTEQFVRAHAERGAT
ncbi:carboxylesterase, partial [Mycobacterium sp. ITM-2017-0098]